MKIKKSLQWIKVCKSTFLCKFTHQLKFAACSAWNPLSPVNLGDNALVSKNIYISFYLQQQYQPQRNVKHNNQILNYELRKKKRYLFSRHVIFQKQRLCKVIPTSVKILILKVPVHFHLSWKSVCVKDLTNFMTTFRVFLISTNMEYFTVKISWNMFHLLDILYMKLCKLCGNFIILH